MMTHYKVLKHVAPIKPGCVDLRNYYVTSSINLYVQQVSLMCKVHNSDLLASKFVFF
jgi:hypothetical protein